MSGVGLEILGEGKGWRSWGAGVGLEIQWGWGWRSYGLMGVGVDVLGGGAGGEFPNGH